MDTITIAAIVVGIYVVSGIIVAVDNRHYDWGTDSVDVSVPLFAVCIALALGGLSWWLYETDYQLFSDINKRLQYWVEHPTPEFPLVVIEGLFALLVTIGFYILVVIIFFGAPIGAVISAGVAVIACIPLLPAIVPLPIFALKPISRGIWAIVKLPFILLREIAYFIAKPRRTIKKIREAVVHHEDKSAAAKQVHQTLVQEREKVRQARRWRPNIKIFASAKHYHGLADYLNSLDRVGKAAHEHLKPTERRSDDR